MASPGSAFLFLVSLWCCAVVPAFSRLLEDRASYEYLVAPSNCTFDYVSLHYIGRSQSLSSNAIRSWLAVASQA